MGKRVTIRQAANIMHSPKRIDYKTKKQSKDELDAQQRIDLDKHFKRLK